MNARPAYFEPIRRRAAQRWDQLKHDREQRGLWLLLFAQVQSPRYVLSELLQNADDAGATEACVGIEDGYFVFSHDGEDFTEEHFASLCRFGYSNKRALHTVGFRGIGFKSTFSLGDTVELYTPTLSVAFDRQGFTEPRWIDSARSRDDRTEIRVAIRDDHRKAEVEENLQEWLDSPISLLFFRNIRHLQIAGKDLHWGSLGPGPTAETEWMALYEDPDQAFLVARSEPAPFPSDALAEIRQERMLGADEESEFPPCRVELVVGAKGRLYVVLPTGVDTALPFACNAPFIQDPARLKIKDPGISPANRWLIERIGALAASVMLDWLGQTTVSVVDRSDAYDLLPDVDRKDKSLDGACATAVELAFEAAIKEQDFILTDSGELKPTGQSVIIPQSLLDVWSPEQAVALFDDAKRPAFSRHVSERNREKLLNWRFVEKIGIDRVLEVLKASHLPRPQTWQGLLRLWAYLSPSLSDYRSRTFTGPRVCIVPVQGKDELYAASEVVRLGERRLLQSDADWNFLATHLLVVNQNWTRYLAEQRRAAEERNDTALQGEVDAAYAMLATIGLEETSDVNTVVERVAGDFFRKYSIPLAGCIQLAQIAAKLGATAGESFRLVDRNLKLRSTTDILLFDPDGALEELLPKDWSAAHLLHPNYASSFSSCTRDEWIRWISSGRAKLHAFAPLVSRRSRMRSRTRVEAEVRRRGYNGSFSYRYVTNDFLIDDWDFEDSLWSYWTSLARTDGKLWGRLAERILEQPEAFWSKAKTAQALQIATTGITAAISDAQLLPNWILKLRDLPCLPDTRGFYHKPVDLLRRTATTEALLDVEPFIHARLDTETTRPLLMLLGVSDKPTGPDHLLDRLRALAKAPNPPIYEVEKWYRRLDQIVDTCSTADFTKIRTALRDEVLILTEGSGWARGSEVFLSSDEEDVPGAPVVRASARELTLWRKIEVAERPTADLAIQWLNGLPSGEELTSDKSRRVRALLARHATRIWNESNHWLNLAGEWVPTDTLAYSLTMQTLVAWGHLFPWVKQKTADFQRLPVETTQSRPFSDLPHLSHQLVEKLCQSPAAAFPPERRPWLNQIGAELRRVQFDDDTETARIRKLADVLATTTWQSVPGLEIIPYIDGTPAGTPARVEVLWIDGVLYYDTLPKARLARAIPEKLGKVFDRPDITAALNYCFGRSPEEVREYLGENFKLGPLVGIDAGPVETPTRQMETDRPLLSLSKEPDVDGESGKASDTTDGSAPEGNEDNGETGHDNEENIDEPDYDGIVRKSKRPSKSLRPSIIDLFAVSQGFQKDGDGRYIRTDGAWIGRTIDVSFPWQRVTAAGDIVRYYWPTDHCLERESLQLDADIWALIAKFPETYALILLNLQGEPIELVGSRLRAMRDEGKLVLHPATYRLVYAYAHE